MMKLSKNGLENFKRDTMWVAVMDTIYPKGFNADSMKYIPYGNGAIFEMNVKTTQLNQVLLYTCLK